MITLLSPAKKQLQQANLDYQGHAPFFREEISSLISQLKKCSEADLEALMSISPKLSKLNVQRYQAFDPEAFSKDNSTQAIFAFQGDVYQSLAANTLSKKALQFSQQHLGILSGLYGLLSPFDWMQAHRLEMGVKFATPGHKNLYSFWGSKISERLNTLLKGHKHQAIINLASKEYSTAIDLKTLEYPCIEIQFKEMRDGKPKVIGILAKRARGTMARYILENQIDDPETLKAFNEDNYCFTPGVSDERTYVFMR